MNFIDYPAWIRRLASMLVAAQEPIRVYNEAGDAALPRRKLEATCKLIHNCWLERNEPAAPWSGVPLKYIEETKDDFQVSALS